MKAFLNNKPILLDPLKAIGKGGEADIYSLGKDQAVKIFKTPDHPDFIGMPDEQKAAGERITEHQKKLLQFPSGLPDRVIAPRELVFDQNGRIIGYLMPLIQPAEVLLRYSDYSFRQNVAEEDVGKILQDAHPTILVLHQRDVVISDFNDLNVLIRGTKAYFIDTDSYGYGGYLSRMFTVRFVDPLLIDPKAKEIKLIQPHNQMSDWYAFNVMVMQSYLLVDPYGGVHRPKNKTEYLTPTKRIQCRITVFDPQVRYPKFARPIKLLPDDLLDHFHKVFVRDQRGIFPLRLISNMRWTKCLKCGIEHARPVCPECAVAPASVKEVVKVRGKVIATEVFRTKGDILHAAWQNQELLWLYNENDRFYREKEVEILKGRPVNNLRYRLKGEDTLIAQDGEVITIRRSVIQDRVNVEMFGRLPIFDTNANYRYFLRNGSIERDGEYGLKRIGNVLSGQTLFWVGPKFGFGFYRVGKMAVYFVFSAEWPQLNDSLKLPPLRGQLLDSTCFFTGELCWFLASTEEGGKIVNHCYVVSDKGELKAVYSAEKGTEDWLENIRGKQASGRSLLAATDDGIVRMDLDNGRIARKQEFPDTEQFVNTHSHLFPGPAGIYVVNRKNIILLKIS